MITNIKNNLRSMISPEDKKTKQDKIVEKYEKLVATIDEQNISIQRLANLLSEDRNAINLLIEVSSFVKEQQDEIVKYIVSNDENKIVNRKKNKDDFVN